MKPTATVKLISAFLAVLLLAGLFPVAGRAYAAGDVDGDGVVRAEDARLCLRRAVGLEDYSAGTPAFTACDITGDGEVSAEDARLILRAAVGLDISAGLSGRTVIAAPLLVYEGKRGAITLTEYTMVESGPLADGAYLVCVLEVRDTSCMYYTVSAEAVTVNGRRLPDDPVAVELPPNGTANLRIVIPEDYLTVSASGEPTADEILARIPFYSAAEQRTYYAKIALYPTGKTAGTVEYPPADARTDAKDIDDFQFHLDGAWYKTETDDEGDEWVSEADAVFYFRNASDRDLTVELTGVTLNNGALRYDEPQELYVFAGTVAMPEIHISPDFFEENPCDALTQLNYVIAVRDARTDEELYRQEYRITRIGERT